MGTNTETIKLTIDDRPVEMPEGATILEACGKLDIKIPTLCHHKALSSYGACRLCLVEIEQNGRTFIRTSCNYPAAEGIKVRTDTERIKRTRKIMAELLLARCPDSERIQSIATDLGVTKKRIELEKDDCILCGLCVRMCREKMGKGVLGFSNRGSERIMSPAYNETSEECQTCGACYDICPTGRGIKFEKITENVPEPRLSEFDSGLVKRSAVYIPYAQAVPNYANIDPEMCIHLNTGECAICTEYCDAGAIDFEQKAEVVDLDVGSIILTTGAKPFDPVVMHQFGYGRYPNVLTSIQFERILAASGPFEGHLQRPSDGREPVKIAWLQCVGSRTQDSHMPYCSSVCCMYAMKEAIIAKEHVDTVEPTIFFMDMRAHGKDFDKYYDRAKETGVRFIRGRVGKIREVIDNGNLILNYTSENGDVHQEEFDLVVLSVGLTPRENSGDLSDKLGVRLNAWNFIDSDGTMPIQTTRPGIFVCGPAVQPKDIPETVIQASGAVAGAAELLASARGTEITKKEYPEEKNVSGQKPRIGVFVCHCGINIGSIVNVPDVVEFAKSLPNVVYAGENLFTCSQDTQEKMKEIIEEYKLNRVVVSSCSPSTHEALFQETMKETGLNPYLFDMANIRNHCSWVHRDDHAKATEKAKILTRIAIGKARLLEPLYTLSLNVTQKALVVGGGLAGITAALSIADQGFEVALVERENRLGGNLNRLKRRPNGEKVSEYIEGLIEKVNGHPKLKTFIESEILAIDGYVGNYVTSIKSKASNEVVDYEHGVIVITTGANESSPEEYHVEDENVLTQLDFEDLLEADPKAVSKLKTVVMIQCVGSRNKEHPYCSRVCCTQAVKNAIRLKKLKPKMNVYILYRDVRTYGFNEIYYQEARSLGVIFIRYEEDAKPVVEYSENGDNQLIVRVEDIVLGSEVEIMPDRIVLAPAMVPQEDAGNLSQMLKIPLNEDNFFMEAHVKLRPVDFSAEGIYLAGLAHSPKQMDETISQAKAAAERACTIISSDEYISVANVAQVDENTCAACGMCVAACPYGAPGLVWLGGREVCQINTALCKGCGSCSTVCPSGAMQQLGYKEIQTLEMVDKALSLL
ncbi:MAG: FAD-dependent oxidoreductase [Candidatus Krumholzibacteriota bacterium]|nr:FAD-dependent oxidoreductase [Candidatus Krumholzibacteriota bacterium]